MAKDALQLAVRNHEGRVLNDDREDLENAKPQCGGFLGAQLLSTK